MKTISPTKCLLLVAVSALTVCAAYAWWGIDDAYVRFAVLFALVAATLATVLSISGFALGSYFILRLLPPDRRAYYRRHKLRYRAIVLAFLLVFCALFWTINRKWLPSKFHPVSIGADIGLLALALWAMWNALVPNLVRGLTMVPVVAVYALALFVVPAISTRSGERPVEVSGRELGALGYVSWVPAGSSGERSGVSLHDDERAFDGLNISCSGTDATAYLMDMQGNILHEWTAEVEEGEYFWHVELFPEGDVLVAVTGGERGLMLRLDWDSNVLWTLDDTHYHHDMAIDANGDVYLLARRNGLVTVRGLPVPLIEDYVVVLSPDREVRQELSLPVALRDEIPRDRPAQIYRWMLSPRNIKRMLTKKDDGSIPFMLKTQMELTHANTVEIIDRDYGGPFRRGAVLFCARDLDLIGVADVHTGSLLWSWGPGILDRPHQPTMLDNGNVLIFDNGMHRGLSRVIELDPRRLEVVWEYESDQFFSHSRGASQRLPNGNTLVTNSNSGHVFEVTPEGEIVWEFYNPATRERYDDEKKETVNERAAIYRMMRIVDPGNYPCLEKLR